MYLVRHNKRVASPKRIAVAMAAVLAACTGCGDGRPERAPVAGRVLIDGQPVESGYIRFHSRDHRPATGKLGPGGAFQLSTYEFGDGCVLGEHPVSVEATELIDSRTRRWNAPKKYRDPAASGLTFEVREATDSATIELTWAGKKPFTERIAGGGGD